MLYVKSHNSHKDANNGDDFGASVNYGSALSRSDQERCKCPQTRRAHTINLPAQYTAWLVTARRGHDSSSPLRFQHLVHQHIMQKENESGEIAETVMCSSTACAYRTTFRRTKQQLPLKTALSEDHPIVMETCHKHIEGTAKTELEKNRLQLSITGRFFIIVM